MIPASLYLSLYRGTDFAVIITCQDSAGNVLDITGYDFQAHVRTTAGSASLVKNLAPSILDAAAGQVQITLTDTDTLAITAGEYVWDMLFQDPDTLRWGPLVAGKFIVREPVTKFP